MDPTRPCIRRHQTCSHAEYPGKDVGQPDLSYARDRKGRRGVGRRLQRRLKYPGAKYVIPAAEQSMYASLAWVRWPSYQVHTSVLLHVHERLPPPRVQGQTRYFNNPSATKSTLDEEGWLHTGDMGYFDEDGGLYIVDRIKEIIKVKGYQVAPAELEALLLTHSEIVDAGVIPFPDQNSGEVPIAYVVRSPGSSLTEKYVMDYVAKQVAPYKRLHGINFVNTIPKSSAGKILRRELVAMAKSKL